MAQDEIEIRLIEMDDAPWVQEALSDRLLARNTSSIPHPLPLNFSKQWIADWRDYAEADRGFRLVAINPEGTGMASGAVKRVNADTGELSFWVAPTFWRKGIGKRIAQSTIQKACNDFNVTYLTAGHFVGNIGSEKLLHALGFKPTGEVISVFSNSRRENVDTIRYLRTPFSSSQGDSQKP